MDFHCVFSNTIEETQASNVSRGFSWHSLIKMPKKSKKEKKKLTDEKKTSNLPVSSDVLEHSNSNSFCPMKKELAYKRQFCFPTSHYDLMPCCKKNRSYSIRFEMAHPQARLQVVHRTVKKTFEELSFEDKVDLLDACRGFTQHYKLTKCILTLHIGQWNLNKLRYFPSTFVAFIYVPDVAQYLALFDKLYWMIPEWPSERWVTEFWPRNSNPPMDPQIYHRSVKANAKPKCGRMRYELKLCYPCPRLSTSSEQDVPKLTVDVSTETRNEDASEDKECEMSLRTVTHPSCLHIKGFSPGDQPCQMDSPYLAKFLDCMYEAASKTIHLNKKGAALCLSLGPPFYLGPRSRVQGFFRTVEFCQLPRKCLPQINEEESERESESERDPEYESDPECESETGSFNAPTLESDSSCLDQCLQGASMATEPIGQETFETSPSSEVMPISKARCKAWYRIPQNYKFPPITLTRKKSNTCTTSVYLEQREQYQPSDNSQSGSQPNGRAQKMYRL